MAPSPLPNYKDPRYLSRQNLSSKSKISDVIAGNEKSNFKKQKRQITGIRVPFFLQALPTKICKMYELCIRYISYILLCVKIYLVWDNHPLKKDIYDHGTKVAVENCNFNEKSKEFFDVNKALERNRPILQEFAGGNGSGKTEQTSQTESKQPSATTPLFSITSKKPAFTNNQEQGGGGQNDPPYGSSRIIGGHYVESPEPFYKDKTGKNQSNSIYVVCGKINAVETDGHQGVVNAANGLPWETSPPQETHSHKEDHYSQESHSHKENHFPQESHSHKENHFPQESHSHKENQLPQESYSHKNDKQSQESHSHKEDHLPLESHLPHEANPSQNISIFMQDAVFTSGQYSHDAPRMNEDGAAKILHPMNECFRKNGFYKEGTDFDIFGDIGGGGFGEVHKIIDKSSKRSYALKKIPVKKFEINELSIWAKLLSPSKPDFIVTLLGAYTYKEYAYVFMELMNDTLKYVALNGVALELNQRKVLALIKPVLHALHHMHKQGFVHADVKAENIFISQDRIKLGDFGLSVNLNQQTSNVCCRGTVNNMAWELFCGGPITCSGDVYALACVVIHLFVGYPPWNEMRKEQIIFTVGKGELPQLPENCNSQMKKLLQDMIQHENRPTALEVLQNPLFRDTSVSVLDNLLQEVLVDIMLLKHEQQNTGNGGHDLDLVDWAESVHHSQSPALLQ
ncbi:serine/threonine-protein kinase PAK mbt-like isoform X2 [Xenia sp. Carnegie-2017]|uniref:serine/threonine-protein kinase PAK mbt-like isoform X2 n=1 Tax=Xenia sp. Carnegie-2017 TaxID=2897299 RepID=UPI001F0350B0|nr:serine/threonine-protein kinase PAK mbt-like isoform X2 [Xenia sp. Carnegie-2017]